METSRPLWATCASAWSPSQWKSVSWCSDRSLLCFSLCALPLVLPLGTTEKSLALSSLHPPYRWLYTLIRSPQAFSSPGWRVPALSFSSGEMLQSLTRLGGPSLDCLQYAHVCLVLVSPALDPAPQMCLTSVEQRAQITSLDLRQLSSWCSPGYYSPSLLQDHVAGWCSTSSPQRRLSPLLQSYFAAGWPPAYTGAWGCFSHVQDFTFGELCGLPVSLFLQPVEVPSGWQHKPVAYGLFLPASTTPPGLVSSANRGSTLPHHPDRLRRC